MYSRRYLKKNRLGREPLSKYLGIANAMPGLIFVQGTFWGLISSVRPDVWESYYWTEFWVSKWVGLDNKVASNCFKRTLNSPRAYTLEGTFTEFTVFDYRAF